MCVCVYFKIEIIYICGEYVCVPVWLGYSKIYKLAFNFR